MAGGTLPCGAGMSWLQGLPATALECIISKLPPSGRSQLRLVNTAAHKLVQNCATRVCYAAVNSSGAPVAGGMPPVQAARIHASAPWSGIRELQIGNTLPPVTEISLLLASCPNVESCKVAADSTLLQRTMQDAPYEVPHSLSLTCYALAAAGHLKHLVVGFGFPLGDEQMCALAACATLSHLQASMDACGPAGWAALMGTTQLRSLVLHHHDGRAPPPSVQVDLRQLSSLTRLHYAGDQYAEDVAQMDAAFDQLQLPASLGTLTLRRLPSGPLTVMPQLVMLEIGADVSTPALNALATACPVLTILKVKLLDLSGPVRRLSSVRHLTVLQLCVVSNDAVFADAFPKLASLQLQCNCFWAGDVRAFQGLQMLQRLDIGKGEYDPVEDWQGDGLLLPSSSFEALAALPKLAHLRLDLHTEHITGLPSLTRLEAVSLVGNPWAWDRTCRLPRGLAASSPPPQLRSATFEFMLVAMDDPDNDPVEMVYTAGSVAEQAVKWLLRAPLLDTVGWAVHGPSYTPCADMTDMRLLALASHPSIKHINIQGEGGTLQSSYNMADSVTKPILRRAITMHASRGLQITYLGERITAQEGDMTKLGEYGR